MRVDEPPHQRRTHADTGIERRQHRAKRGAAPRRRYMPEYVGREGGMEAMQEYLQTKSVWIDMEGNTPNPFGLR